MTSYKCVVSFNAVTHAPQSNYVKCYGKCYSKNYKFPAVVNQKSSLLHITRCADQD